MYMAILTQDVWPKDGKERSHIPRMPVWVAGLRLMQMAVAIVLVTLTVWGLTTMQQATNYRRITSFSGSEGFPFSWFVFAWTSTYIIWLGLAVMFIPIMYNRWVHLGLEIITVVFWMVCFALLASHTDDLGSLDAFILTFGTKYEAYYKKNVERYARLFVVATFAATAVSTFNFVLFLVSITVFGRELHRYQLSKLRATEDGVKLESMDHRKNLDLSSHGDDGRYHHQYATELAHHQPTLELPARDPRYHTAELNHHQPTPELQALDPRYHTAELEDSRRRVELE